MPSSSIQPLKLFAMQFLCSYDSQAAKRQVHRDQVEVVLQADVMDESLNLLLCRAVRSPTSPPTSPATTSLSSLVSRRTFR